jgi:hypothetical protein
VRSLEQKRHQFRKIFPTFNQSISILQQLIGVVMCWSVLDQKKSHWCLCWRCDSWPYAWPNRLNLCCGLLTSSTIVSQLATSFQVLQLNVTHLKILTIDADWSQKFDKRSVYLRRREWVIGFVTGCSVQKLITFLVADLPVPCGSSPFYLSVDSLW